MFYHLKNREIEGKNHIFKIIDPQGRRNTWKSLILRIRKKMLENPLTIEELIVM